MRFVLDEGAMIKRILFGITITLISLGVLLSVVEVRKIQNEHEEKQAQLEYVKQNASDVPLEIKDARTEKHFWGKGYTMRYYWTVAIQDNPPIEIAISNEMYASYIKGDTLTVRYAEDYGYVFIGEQMLKIN